MPYAPPSPALWAGQLAARLTDWAAAPQPPPGLMPGRARAAAPLRAAGRMGQSWAHVGHRAPAGLFFSLWKFCLDSPLTI